jgi:hypothetical protein
MKKLTRARVVPINSASVSWLIFATIGSGRGVAPATPRPFAERDLWNVRAMWDYCALMFAALTIGLR